MFATFFLRWWLSSRKQQNGRGKSLSLKGTMDRIWAVFCLRAVSDARLLLVQKERCLQSMNDWRESYRVSLRSQLSQKRAVLHKFFFLCWREEERKSCCREFYVCIKKGMKWHENKHFENEAKVLIMLKNYSRFLVRCRSFPIWRWQSAADEWLMRHFGYFPRLHWTLSEMNEPRWPSKLVHVKMGSWQLNFYDPKLFFNDLKIMQTDKTRRLYRRL